MRRRITWCCSRSIGPFGRARRSTIVAGFIDDEVRRLISQGHDEAHDILTTHIDALHRIAERLIDQETVDAKDVAEIFFDVPKWEHADDGKSVRIQAPSATETTAGDGVAAAHSEPV